MTRIHVPLLLFDATEADLHAWLFRLPETAYNWSPDGEELCFAKSEDALAFKLRFNLR